MKLPLFIMILIARSYEWIHATCEETAGIYLKISKVYNSLALLQMFLIKYNTPCLSVNTKYNQDFRDV